METLPPGWAGRVTDLGDLVELLTVSALPSEPAEIRTALPYAAEGEPFRVDAVADGDIYSSALADYVAEAEQHRAAAAAFRVALEQIVTLAGSDLPGVADSAFVDTLAEVRGLAAAVLHAVAIP